MNETIVTTKQRKTPRRDIKIATLRGKEAKDVWKALGKDGLVYNTAEGWVQVGCVQVSMNGGKGRLPYQMNEQKLEVIVTDNSINIIHRF